MQQGFVRQPWISKQGSSSSSGSMQEAGASSQPAPGPSQGPSPIKRSFSDSVGSRQMGPSPVKRPCPESQLQRELERLLKKEAFLESQLPHLLQALRKRYDDERQTIAEEQRRLADRLLEINNTARSEEDALRERTNLKLNQVRCELAELRKKMCHGGSSSSSSRSNSSIHAFRGLQEDMDNEMLQNSAAGREDVGSAAHFEQHLSTSQQSEVAESSPEVHQQPNEESDGEISSSSDILILQAAGLLAEIGNAAESTHDGKQESGRQQTSPRDTKDQEPEAMADSSGADQKEDQEEQKEEKELAFLKLKNIGTSFEEELQCSICNELLVAAVTINCAHSFCKYCLGEWKKQRAECPMCRVPITAEHRSVTLDSVINTLVGQLSVELQQRHKEMLEERAAIDAAAAAVAALSGPSGGAGAVGPGAARQGTPPGRGARNHHHNYNWQPHPAVPPPYAHPHPPHAHYPPHAHAHPPHAHPPHLNPPHAHPAHVHPPHAHHHLAHPPPPHAHIPPPPAHVQPARTPPGPAHSPDHHLRVRRRHGRNILSSGSSSGSSSDEPSDSPSSYSSSGGSQSTYASSGGFSNTTENSWFDPQYMSAEYEDEDNDYGAPAPAPVVPGIPGRYYGGYGVCFYCNQRGHWSNGCPVRFGGF